MTALRRLVSVACWALLLSSYSASINSQPQDPTTGNLINFTGTPTAITGNWNNGVYVNGLTCWQPGDPGNCGPRPNVQTNGAINFSYGQVDLNQVININQALAAAGNNLQVTGFNFGFRAKNGNGWDDGRQDYLSAYVKFLNSTGGIAANYDYTQHTNRQYNWTNFLFSETFANPSIAATYKTAQVGFIGRDNNFWSGPYGPEIANVSFNLKYRVDPCATDPTSSPTCPGFAAAMNAKTPAPTPVAAPTVEVVTVVPTVTSSISSTTAKPVADIAKPSTPARSVAVATALSTIAKNQQREQAIQNSAVQTATSDAANAGQRAQQEAVAVAASLTTMSQTLSNASIQTQRQSTAAIANTATVSQAQSGPPAVSTAPVNNENKSVAVVTTTVQTAPPRVSTPVVASVSSSASITNDTVSTAPVAQSYFNRTQTTTPVQETIISSPPPQPNKSSSTAAAVTIPPITVTTTNTPVFSQPNVDYQQSTMTFAYVQPQNTMFYAMAAAPVEQQQQTTVQPVSFARSAEIEQVNNAVNFMTNRTDPLNEVVEAKPLATTVTTESSQTVKANVSSNELAGGVDISRLATTPAGYGSYTSLMLQDGKLYEPKEIYKNQKPVDNARALRQLSTDRLHQQMIEQQYRR